jgi:hypothetical protein
MPIAGRITGDEQGDSMRLGRRARVAMATRVP